MTLTRIFLFLALLAVPTVVLGKAVGLGSNVSVAVGNGPTKRIKELPSSLI